MKPTLHTIITAATAIYFATLAPKIANLIADAATNTATQSPKPTLALLLVSAAILLVTLLELYAFPKKMAYVKKSIQKTNEDAELGGVILWMFHAVVSIIMVFAAFKTVEYSQDISFIDNPWMSVIIFAVVIKELYLLFSIFDYEEDAQPKKLPKTPEWKTDVMLTAYTWIAYTTVWLSIIRDAPMERENPPMFILNLVVASILFLILYLPIQIPYFIEATSKDRKTKLNYAASIAVILIAALYSIAQQ